MKRLLWLLIAYWRTRHFYFANRAELEAYQAGRIKKFLSTLRARSRYFAQYRGMALADFPVMNKAIMLSHFDTMNSAGLNLHHAMEVAMQAERSRDFSPTIGNITVGLSSGTSAQRGIFAVSDKEKAEWAGVILAKTLPQGLFSGERVALLLRANSNLYHAISTPWLSFRFFDLFKPIDMLSTALEAYRPSVIVAPAQVLRHLALAVIAGKLRLAPKRVFAAAEVLEAQDRMVIRQAFGEVHEIYQATEGFLASTCEHGMLHLNEEYLQIESQWLDVEQRRFVPVITDFSRLTQPIVRYRLDDVLVASKTPCSCGRVTRSIERIEGRCDDMLLLPDASGVEVSVFSDVLSRALAQVLPIQADYRLIQTGDVALHFSAAIGTDRLVAVREHINKVLGDLGVDIRPVVWTLDDVIPKFDPTKKRRRILRVPFSARKISGEKEWHHA